MIVYFVNSIDISIFAPTFISKAKTSTTKRTFTIKNKHSRKVEKQTYTYDEAFAKSLEYFKGDELAARVWVNKYAVKDSFGNIYEQSPEDMHWRIANEVARIEAKYANGLSAQELFELFDHFKYIVPQGSPMTGIGNDRIIRTIPVHLTRLHI